MAGKYGSASATVTLDDHGGTPRIITAHVLTIGGLKITEITEENSPFGMANEQYTPVGKQKFGPVALHGNYDTTATLGPHVMFSTLETTPQDTTRTLVVSPDGTKLLTVEVFAVEYEPVLTDGKLTSYNATLVQAGLAAWT
jgi:glucose/arabinose dehydrogenase